MVLSIRPEATQLLLVGPWSHTGEVLFGPDVHLLWIRFRLGVYMPHLLTRQLVNQETILPQANDNHVWLKSEAWQIPVYNNADTFIDRLARKDILTMDPLVSAFIDEQPLLSHLVPFATVFTDNCLSHNHIFQVRRAHQAAEQLRQGLSILDVVEAGGYYDQPHLTHMLKRFIGYTPAQILHIDSDQ